MTIVLLTLRVRLCRLPHAESEEYGSHCFVGPDGRATGATAIVTGSDWRLCAVAVRRISPGVRNPYSLCVECEQADIFSRP